MVEPIGETVTPNMDTQHRLIAIQQLSMIALSFFPLLISAEPIISRLKDSVIHREVPKPFFVEDYHGEITQNHRTIEFIAPGGFVRWEPWVEHRHLSVVQKAMRIVEERALDSAPCNHYFVNNMPNRRSLRDIWTAIDEKRIRISFSPGNSALWRAATYGITAPYEWTITESTVNLGPESVASAMIHEATRTNGIGHEYSIAANAEIVCGMRNIVLNESILRKLGWDSRIKTKRCCGTNL